MNETTESYVGIDVSKKILDTAIGQTGDLWQSANDRKGIADIVTRLEALQPALIVVESTGGLEIRLLTALFEAKLPFCRVHPGRVREFARSVGRYARQNRPSGCAIASSVCPSSETTSYQLTWRG